jgi:diadenosine tetraphosphate (Ap4A) HIT family hydrolase
VAEFALHPRLAAGSAAVGRLRLCHALLKDDARWPWLILVPARVGLEEWHDLSPQDAAAVEADMRHASRLVAGLPGVQKVNIGALGNVVRQLHIHVVGRWDGDAAWPGPIWGVEGKVAYAPDELTRLAAMFTAAFADD